MKIIIKSGFMMITINSYIFNNLFTQPFQNPTY